MASKIPVIDLQAFPGETAKLIEACQEWGCFRIKNYEEMLPELLLQEMRNVVMSLFALPAEIKMRCHNAIPERRYLRPTPVNPRLETFGLYDATCHHDVDDFCSKLEISPIQRNVIFNYAKGMKEVEKYIARKIAEGLGVKGFSFEDWSGRLRINKYEYTPETMNCSGIQLHTDPSFLTLVDDDKDIGGLEVITKSGEFEPVVPSPNTLVVNLGDMATVWSNGRFLNAKHHVVCGEARTRISLASYLMAPKNGMVEAPLELVDSNHPRLFPPINYHDFLNLKISKSEVTGEILDFVRIQNNKDLAKDETSCSFAIIL